MPEKVNTSFLCSNIDDVKDTSDEVAIEVDDVSMVFNMASETMNNLKEYAIALARRELRFKEFRALDHVSFDVKKGDVFGILGTNGSGKSTLLKIIAGVLEPSEGSCVAHGSIAPLIELGAGFDVELTARENIFLNGALLGYSKKFIEQHFDEIVEFAEVEGFLDMPLKNYSSGMVARVAFAVATVIVPEILIVDEVLSVGDFMFQQKCERRIRSLIRDHGVTVLIVSHSNKLIERLCNKAVWIEKGHLRAIGSAKEICQIYEILGGRVGSSRAEQEVFRIFQSSVDVDSHLASVLTGHDRLSTAARITDATPFEERPTAGVVAPAESPNICLLAESVAPLLNAAVIPVPEDDFPDSCVPALDRLDLRTLYVLGDASLISDYTVERMRERLCCQVERLEGSDERELTSLVSLKFWPSPADMLSHSSEKKSATAVFADRKASLALIALSPYFCESNCSLHFLSEGSHCNKQIAEASIEGQYDRIVVLGNQTVCEEIANACANLDAETVFFSTDEDPWKTNLRINEWIVSHSGLAYDHLVLIIEAVPEDGYLIGQYAGLSRSLVILEDPNNLDNVVSSFQVVKDNPVASLTFVGGSLFNQTDKDILLKAIAMRELELEN